MRTYRWGSDMRKIQAVLRARARAGGGTRILEDFWFSSLVVVITEIPCSSADRKRTLVEHVIDEVNASVFLRKISIWVFCSPLHSFSCYRPVHCRSCLYQHQSHQPQARVDLSVGLGRGEVTVTVSSDEQLASFRIRYGATWFDMYNNCSLFKVLNGTLLYMLDTGIVSSAKRIGTSGIESVRCPRCRKVSSKKN